MQIIQSRAQTQDHLHYLSFTFQEAIFLYPNHPRARCQTTRDYPHAPEPSHLFKLPNSIPAQLLILPHPLILWKTTIEAFAHALPLLLLLLTGPGACSCGPTQDGFFSSLGNYNKLSFQWRSSPDLLTTLYLNKTKIPSTV